MQEQERILDLQLELETAYLFLQEKTLNVVYEPQYGKVRGPDFAVTFTTRLTFMVEVTRLRKVQTHMNGQETSFPLLERLIDATCSKLGQMLLQRSNVLIVGVDPPLPTLDELQPAMVRFQQRVERDESALLQRYHFRDRADFFHQFQRLSEIFVRDSQRYANESNVLWINPQAKYPLPNRVRSALYRHHG
jgi:hypothetical protein